MNRRTAFRQMAVTAAVVAFANLLCGAETERSTAPNFLLILSDDQGWSQLSREIKPGLASSKSDYLETPNIDRLGKEGVRFSSGYSPAAICTPTRRSIQCGTSAARTGNEFKTWWPTAEKLTIPKALKSVNPDYRCAHFGKWGTGMGASPDEAGYDASDGQTCNPQGNHHPHELNPQCYVMEDDPKMTGSVTKRAIDFITESAKAGRPFYTQVSYYAVHLDIEVRPETVKHFEEKGEPDRAYLPAFAGMLKEMDDGVGRLLTALEKLGIADNTYVVFMSDNGGLSFDKVSGRKGISPVAPLYQGKWYVYEGGIRVPFLVRGPRVPAGKSSTVPVCGYDLMPTFYDLAGGKDPMPPHVDGGSLKTVMENPDSGAVQRPLDGLVFVTQKKGPNTALRSVRYKLMLTWEKDGSAIKKRELFDAVNDVGEKNNLIEQHPEIAASMEKTLLNYLRAMDTPLSPQQYKQKCSAAKGANKRN
jgi:arylsulfatase A